MIRLGLTGSYASGKSTVATLFRREGIPVFDADKAAHAALQYNLRIHAEIKKCFAQTVTKDGIDRRALGNAVFGNEEATRWLERLIHPEVQAAERLFFRNAMLRRVAMTLSEIPLLFETGAEVRYDAVICTTAPLLLMEERAFKRPGMTRKKFAAILARQLPAEIKAHRADFVIHTGLGKAYTCQKVKELIIGLRHAPDRTGYGNDGV